MSAEASNSMSAAWANLEGHVINGMFPLLRFVGSSELSGVFLTESARHTQSRVAVKLIPVSAARMDSQLAHWRAVVELDHPHLLRMFEAGQCEIGDQRYLYAVIEHADQNLSQLLENRALAEDEAREMLVPTLSALAFLHERKLVQGGLKPSNVLVVGDQLKLASDTVKTMVGRTMVDAGVGIGPGAGMSAGINAGIGSSALADMNALSAYDPPEARDGVRSAPGDIWALGITMCEALTRRRPAGLHAGGGSIVLPPDMPQAFREVVARCLRKPAERPRVTELQAWLRGEGLERAAPVTSQAAMSLQPPVPQQPELPRQLATSSRSIPSSQPTPPSPPAQPPRPAPIVMPEPAAQPPPVSPIAPPATEPGSKSTTRLVIRAELTPKNGPETLVSERPKWRVVPLAVVGIAVLGVLWAGVRMFTRDDVVAPPAGEVAPSASRPAPSAASAPKPAPAVRAASSSTSPAQTSRVEPAPTPALETVNEVIPDVSLRSRQTIRGTVRVSIRLIVDKDGKVFAALTDKAGPSRYFERLALDAAKKWTFTPADSAGQRVVLVRFSFTRSGTTARATALR